MIAGLIESVGGVVGTDGLVALVGYLIKSSLFLLVAMGMALASRMPSIRNLILRAAILGIVVLTIAGPLLPSVSLPLPGFVSTSFTFSSTELSVVDQTIAVAETVEHNLPWASLIIVIWITGGIAIGGRYLAGVFSAGRMVTASTKVTDQRILTVVARVRRDLNLRASVRTLISEDITVPIVWGIVRPVVILPANIREWTLRQIEMVLRHEMAHVCRADVFWLNLANLATAVQWFNPLIWMVRGRMARESELACDDSVLAIGIQSQEYAQHLLHTARDWGRSHRLVAAGLALTNNNQLKGRIMSVLSKRKRSIIVSKAVNAAIFAVTLLVVLSMAVVSIQAGDKQTDEKAKKEQIMKDQVKKEQAKKEYAKQVKAKKEQAENEQAEKGSEDFPAPDEFIKVDLHPEMIFQQAPEYPEKAKQAGIEGTVWVQALVDKKGAIRKAKVSKSSGTKSLDKAAVTAAYQNKFKPAIQKDKPVAVWITYKIEFALDDKDSSKSKK